MWCCRSWCRWKCDIGIVIKTQSWKEKINKGKYLTQRWGNYFENNASYRFIVPYVPDWLSIYSNQGLNGELFGGESTEITIHADATNVTEGMYFADLIISSNIEDSVEIPITLLVADSGIIGDLNGDQDINVSDIVMLVSLILYSDDYFYNADINQDGTINVSDVVLLVNFILNE